MKNDCLSDPIMNALSNRHESFLNDDTIAPTTTTKAYL